MTIEQTPLSQDKQQAIRRALWGTLEIADRRARLKPMRELARLASGPLEPTDRLEHR